MKSIGVQFHAEPSEVLDLIKNMIIKFKLKSIIMILRPFKIKIFEKDEIRSVYLECESEGRIRFSLSKEEFVINCETKNEFLVKNPNICHFDVGRIVDNKLEESFFSVKTEDEEILSISKSIAKEIKKVTKAGVTAINPDSGAKAYIRANRYTKAAERLQEEGVEMLPSAGKSRIVFGKH